MSGPESLAAEAAAASEALLALNSGVLVVDADVLAGLLGQSTWSIYDAVKRGNCPIPALRVGRRIKFRVHDCRELLGIATPSVEQ